MGNSSLELKLGYILLHMERVLYECKQDIFAHVLMPEISTLIFEGAASFGIDELISMLSYQ